MNDKMDNLIKKAKEFFLLSLKKFGADPYNLYRHVYEAEKWANYLLSRNPSVDHNTVLLTVWLHDIGHYPIPTTIDHAVRSFHIADNFLKKNNSHSQITENTLHCIRSHRCKDIMPSSPEAKLFIIIDSASHMTDSIYFDMARQDKQDKITFRALAKLERDIKDIMTDIDLGNELKDLYNAWRNLLTIYEKTPV